jgi:pyridoxine 5-phosphate synthase
MKTAFSININKIALLRNSRGANIPDVVKFAQDCERYGADGITIHPRPDERHIKFSDVYELAKIYPNANCEYNIEGYPSDDFIKMVIEAKPNQCTLVPDSPDQLTSDNGWDTKKHFSLLTDVVKELHSNNIRVSLFIDPIEENLEWAAKSGAERIEFYTGPFAHEYYSNPEKAIEPIKNVLPLVNELGLGINAGHDLNLDNLKFLKQNIPNLLEVSIGHAFVRDCLYFGLENTVNMYKRLLD